MTFRIEQSRKYLQIKKLAHTPERENTKVHHIINQLVAY